MKNLVLGASGQVGAHLVSFLRDAGEDVIPWDIGIHPQHDLRNEDYTSNRLRKEMYNCDFVYFLAFDVGGSTYLAKHQKTFEFIHNNIKIMNNVFTLLEQTHKPFIFASSQMSNMFDSVYGRLKAVGESYTDSLPSGLNVRFWNVFGVERDPEKTHVITDFVRMALNDGRILVRTDGTEKRNFLYAEDASNMLFNCALGMTNQDLTIKNLYFGITENLGAIPIACPLYGSTVRVSDLARIIRDLIDPNIPIFFGDKKDTSQTIFNDPYNILAPWENDLLMRGRKFTELKDGIKKIIIEERKEKK